MIFLTLLGTAMAILVVEILFTWFIGHITDDTEEFTAAWMFSCILNSTILAYVIMHNFGMFE